MRRNYKNIAINTSKNTHEKVFSMINKDTNAFVVDIPCGSGAFVQRLKDYGYQNVKAIDIENTLEIDHDDFSVGDMTEKLPVSDNSVDILVCIDGIEHISRQFDFVQEVHRILKEGGEFILSTPNISSIRSRWKWFTTGHHHKYNAPLDENNPSALHHIGLIDFPGIRYLLHTNGFKLNQVTTNWIKPISWFFLIFVPLIYLSTSWVYYKTGKKQKTRKINKKVFRTMFSKEVLFGETLITKATKIQLTTKV